jgi:putative transcriptional regulator
VVSEDRRDADSRHCRALNVARDLPARRLLLVCVMPHNANERWREITGCPPRRRRRPKPYQADEEPEGLVKPRYRPSGTLEDNPLPDPLAKLSLPSGERNGPTAARADVEFTPVDIVELRYKFHATQRHFAKMFGISLGTLRNWEQGRRRPHGPARALLRVARAHPEAVARTLWRYRRTWWMD